MTQVLGPLYWMTFKFSFSSKDCKYHKANGASTGLREAAVTFHMSIINSQIGIYENGNEMD